MANKVSDVRVSGSDSKRSDRLQATCSLALNCPSLVMSETPSDRLEATVYAVSECPKALPLRGYVLSDTPSGRCGEIVVEQVSEMNLGERPMSTIYGDITPVPVTGYVRHDSLGGLCPPVPIPPAVLRNALQLRDCVLLYFDWQWDAATIEKAAKAGHTLEQPQSQVWVRVTDIGAQGEVARYRGQAIGGAIYILPVPYDSPRHAPVFVSFSPDYVHDIWRPEVDEPGSSDDRRAATSRTHRVTCSN